LVDGVPKISNVGHYSRIVKEKSILRNVIHGANAIQIEAMEARDSGEIVGRLIQLAGQLSENSAKKPAVQIYTAPQLIGMVGETVDAIAFPFAVRGMVAVIDGGPKISGKTTLTSTAIAACDRGELFLNRATKRVCVLLVTEENHGTMSLVLRRAGLTEMENLHIICANTTGMQWPQLAQLIEQACEKLGITWLIVDTFFGVAGLGGELENQAGTVDAAVAPIRRIAGRLNIAVTLTRHARKSGGQIGESGRGSSALTGGVDIVCELKRISGSRNPNIRSLEITGRVGQEHLRIELRDGKYIVCEESGDENTSVSVRQTETERVSAAIKANPRISKLALEKITGVGRMRVEKLAGDLGWLYTRKGGWQEKLA
jgi:AAA domain